jgi:hypothetical protein
LALAILELNDAGINATVDGNLVLNSPAYAVLHEDQLYVGEEALKKVRLYPRWTNNKFWQQLNTDSISNGTHQIRHHADLAFFHLEKIWGEISSSADEVIFAVPGSFDAKQLGLLLGIARESGIPVVGLVDSALAAVIEQEPSRTVMHLDIQLHHIVLTVFQSKEVIKRQEFAKITELGLATLWDRWANIIADLFIQNTRFDPMHEAGTEQQLFDHLPEWIEDFSDKKAKDYTLQLNQTSHSVSVSTEKLLTACTNVYPQIVQQIRNRIPQGQTVQLCLSDRFKGFPGLLDSLNLLQRCTIIQLGSKAVFEGIINHLSTIRSESEALSYITHLPIDKTVLTATSSAHSHSIVTHLLHGHKAVPLGKVFKLDSSMVHGIRQTSDQPQCTIYFRGTELLLHNHKPEGTLVNDETVTDHIGLQPGDRIQLEGQIIQLICVEADHGA